MSEENVKPFPEKQPEPPLITDPAQVAVIRKRVAELEQQKVSFREQANARMAYLSGAIEAQLALIPKEE